MFCQFQPGVAYKSVAYKKKRVVDLMYQFSKCAYLYLCFSFIWMCILPVSILKVEKNEDENFQLFIWNRYSFQNSITKISILSNHLNVIFSGFYFEKIKNKALSALTIRFRIYEFWKKFLGYRCLSLKINWRTNIRSENRKVPCTVNTYRVHTEPAKPGKETPFLKNSEKTWKYSLKKNVSWKSITMNLGSLREVFPSNLILQYSKYFSMKIVLNIKCLFLNDYYNDCVKTPLVL